MYKLCKNITIKVDIAPGRRSPIYTLRCSLSLTRAHVAHSSSESVNNLTISHVWRSKYSDYIHCSKPVMFFSHHIFIMRLD